MVGLDGDGWGWNEDEGKRGRRGDRVPMKTMKRWGLEGGAAASAGSVGSVSAASAARGASESGVSRAVGIPLLSSLFFLLTSFSCFLFLFLDGCSDSWGSVSLEALAPDCSGLLDEDT